MRPAIKLAPDIALEDDWYAVQPIDAYTFAIGEPGYHQQNWSYLLLGDTRAVLFDTGSFSRDITGVISRRVNLPLTVLPSHMHFDHLGNITRFDDIAIADLPILRDCVTDDVLTPPEVMFLGAWEGNEAPSFAVQQWIAIGSDIDLGGRCLKLLHTPGHSPDSVSLLEAGANCLYSADFIYPGDLYGQVPGASLPDYLDAAVSLQGEINNETMIYCAHGNKAEDEAHTAPLLQASDLQALIGALRDIRSEASVWSDEQKWTVRISDNLSIIISADALSGWR